MDIALEILKDLDYDEKTAVNIYQELILEDINSTYILVSDDTNSKIIFRWQKNNYRCIINI